MANQMLLSEVVHVVDWLSCWENLGLRECRFCYQDTYELWANSEQKVDQDVYNFGELGASFPHQVRTKCLKWNLIPTRYRLPWYHCHLGIGKLLKCDVSKRINFKIVFNNINFRCLYIYLRYTYVVCSYDESSSFLVLVQVSSPCHGLCLYHLKLQYCGLIVTRKQQRYVQVVNIFH